MKPIGWTLLVLGFVLILGSAALQAGLLMPWGGALTPSPVLLAVAGVLLLCAGYCATRLSRR